MKRLVLETTAPFQGLPELVAFDEPVRLPDEESATGVGNVLIDSVGEVICHANDQLVTGLPAGSDRGLADEAEVGLVVLVADDVSVLFDAVVPKHDRLVDLTGDSERDLAVTLAGGRGLELGNALLEIGAAVTTEVSRGGRHHGRRGQDRKCYARP